MTSKNFEKMFTYKFSKFLVLDFFLIGARVVGLYMAFESLLDNRTQVFRARLKTKNFYIYLNNNITYRIVLISLTTHDFILSLMLRILSIGNKFMKSYAELITLERGLTYTKLSDRKSLQIFIFCNLI